MTARFLLTSLYKKVVVKNNITPLCLCNPFLLIFYQTQICVRLLCELYNTTTRKHKTKMKVGCC